LANLISREVQTDIEIINKNDETTSIINNEPIFSGKFVSINEDTLKSSTTIHKL